MAVEDWASALKNNLETISGIQQVHNYNEIPSNVVVFPSILILPEWGTQEVGATNIAIHNLRVTLFIAGQIIPEAYALAVPFIQLVRNKIASDLTLGGLVQYCLPVQPPGRWYEGPGAKEYAGKTFLAIDFFLAVKERETFTVA